MKKILGIILAVGALSLSGCEGTLSGTRTLDVKLINSTPDYSGGGISVFDFASSPGWNYVTDVDECSAVNVTKEDASTLAASVDVSSSAKEITFFTAGLSGSGSPFSVPSSLTKSSPSTSAAVGDMGYYSKATAIAKKGSTIAYMNPVTAGVVLDIFDSGDKWKGYKLSTVTIESALKSPLAADFKLRLSDGTIGEIYSPSGTVVIECASGAFEVGDKSATISLGAVVLPCNFQGTVTLKSESENTAVFTIESGLKLEAGYVTHCTLDIASAKLINKKHMPTRLAIMGDSISTFKGKIPSDHKYYYPSTRADCADVDSWEKTYWGHLINEYWKCELDVNSAWSGSCVADGDPANNRTPFVKRCSLFKNPDVIILYGGTNDCQAAREIALGEFDYTSSLDKLNKYARFREAYIWVIGTLQKNYPDAQIICILGNRIDGEYGNSVKAIAEHFELPLVDLRGDTKITPYGELHPNAAGHAQIAKRIYEETLYLFQ